MDAKSMIKRHEGFRRYAYKDTRGVLTIGYGFNLDHWMTYGISIEEADALLEAKVRVARREASLIPGWENCSEVRQAVVIDMVYNLGLKGVLGFKRMIAGLKARDWQKAAAEMLDSRWARQVKTRAAELAEMMRTGEWQGGIRNGL